jgi:hypothetical protein
MTLFWHAVPGTFVNQHTGVPYVGRSKWTGSPREWPETLLETCVSVALNDMTAYVPDARSRLSFVAGVKAAKLLEACVGISPKQVTLSGAPDTDVDAVQVIFDGQVKGHVCVEGLHSI